MRALALTAVTAVLIAACGGTAQPAPTAAATTRAPTAAPTTAAPAAAASVTFKADLKTTNEVPPIANDEKSGSGTATVTFDLTRSAAGGPTPPTTQIHLPPL